MQSRYIKCPTLDSNSHYYFLIICFKANISTIESFESI
uniref:Uncharacterized protein n=1 Tax=Lepeophtheirus salmonis TaxID=72036 RepID=A0A0K2USY3_LEPSM